MVGGAGPKSYSAVISLRDFGLIRLQCENETIQISIGKPSDLWATIMRTHGGYDKEAYWNRASNPVTYLISTVTGERKEIPIYYPYISNTGKYLIGSDSNIQYLSNSLICYNTETGKTVNTTRSSFNSCRD